ncbi:23S rRNA (uracil(1939)-C(5))-methyltransferase RlmD [Pollutibacter soli]|uniref:23S rRNA (uracil(1939)-C(5))-methyltransferase RlmD n=1 Tax=Pollutibacter soli TaxID=3034157 RepID=UPI003013BA47
MRKKKVQVLRGIRVTGYAAEGKALAKQDGKVIFIEGAVPGDLVDVRLTKSKKDWAEGKVQEIIEYSTQRTDPFCEHFGVCGGCKWQMLPYELQLKYKQEEVEQQLRRIGKVKLPPIQPILGSEKTRYYRNKLEFTFSSKRFIPYSVARSGESLSDDQLKPALGFHVPGIFDKVVDVQQCFLQDDPSNAIRNEARSFALANDFSFYDIRNHAGWLRNLMVRVCTTGEVMVNLVTGADEPENRKMMMDHLLAKFPSITSFFYTINTKFNDSIHDLEPVCFMGNPFATEMLGELKFRIGPKSFFQTNTRQAERLYEVTKQFAELTGTETVYDLYCGTGSIGLFVSDLAKKIIGVEVIAEAIRDAKINAEINGINHARFFAGDVIDVCDEQFFHREGKPDVIITDPPRAGMHEKLVNKIKEIAAPKVVYVSCNPATQARDLALLDELYSVERIQPVDMFPHTHHIENIVQLKYRNV